MPAPCVQVDRRPPARKMIRIIHGTGLSGNFPAKVAKYERLIKEYEHKGGSHSVLADDLKLAVFESVLCPNDMREHLSLDSWETMGSRTVAQLRAMLEISPSCATAMELAARWGIRHLSQAMRGLSAQAMMPRLSRTPGRTLARSATRTSARAAVPAEARASAWTSALTAVRAAFRSVPAWRP